MTKHLTISGCEGHGQCFLISPLAFEPDEYGFSQARVDEIPPELEQAVRAAESACPERAIRVLFRDPAG